MKKNLLIALLLTSTITFSYTQCSNVGSVISSSTATLVNMYTPARYFVTPASANTYFWVLSDFNGNILAQDSTTGNFKILNFTATLLDSLKICQTVKNSSTGEVCGVCDTISRGAVASWELITSNTGDTTTSSSGGGGSSVSLKTIETITANIYPNPTRDIINITVEGNFDYTATLFSVNGKQILTAINTPILNVCNLSKGFYFLEIKGINTNKKVMKKIVKL
ncbi:T9SS type A sorting domain-containing protein [bacterium]|nr:T9SS type A sorting domain-containing protein [bacterium]MDB4088688.1 T9SS type A sorting domain-containing protein [Flavobacteriales bacterium]